MPESEIQRVSQRVFVAGKGGVGKTTLATAIAYGFARAGLRTLLITTDPAAHTGLVLGAEVTDEPTPAPDVPLLEVSRIDPVAETRRYREWTLSEAKRLYAADTVERLRQELNSPCTEEVAVFRRFLSVLLSDAYPRVVFDTAPTGHTLRLLSLPLSYRQQLTVKAVGQDTGSGADAAEVQRMADALALLRDPSRTTFAWVVIPEATPIREAARAAAELGTIGIPTRLVLANKMLPEDVCTHPLFRKRYELQQGHVRTMAGHFPGAEVVPVPLQAGEVIGLNAVEALLQSAPGLVQIGTSGSPKWSTGGEPWQARSRLVLLSGQESPARATAGLHVAKRIYCPELQVLDLCGMIRYAYNNVAITQSQGPSDRPVDPHRRGADHA